MADLDDRYGRTTRPRWVWILVAVVGIGVGAAWAAWVAFQPRPVTAELYGYDVIDDAEVVLTLRIHRPEPVAVTCSVYAQAQDHSIVGERDVEIAASDRKTVYREVRVKTLERAVTGVLRTCVPRD